MVLDLSIRERMAVAAILVIRVGIASGIENSGILIVLEKVKRLQGPVLGSYL
ncbi:MAG: hypothetical protein QXE19_02605 [Candidatus Bathyarchaeia archaeon]